MFWKMQGAVLVLCGTKRLERRTAQRSFRSLAEWWGSKKNQPRTLCRAVKIISALFYFYQILITGGGYNRI